MMFTASNGNQYMLPTKDGRVTPAGQVGGGVAISVHNYAGADVQVAPSADGRITHGCPGLWSDAQTDDFKRITDWVRAKSDAKIGLQIGHAGPKGSTCRPWQGAGMDQPVPADDAEGNWPLIAASPIPYLPHGDVPRAMTRADMDRVTADFVASTQRAAQAGFDWLELHCAHGYLLSSFISPLTNQRTDEYGGSLANRLRYPLEVFAAVRAAWPKDLPMSVRISAHDWVEGGITPTDAVEIARAFIVRLNTL